MVRRISQEFKITLAKSVSHRRGLGGAINKTRIMDNTILQKGERVSTPIGTGKVLDFISHENGINEYWLSMDSKGNARPIMRFQSKDVQVIPVHGMSKSDK